MVALLVRLRLTLLRNGLKRSVWRTVGLIIGAVYALGLVAGVWAGMIGLRFTSVQLTGDVTVVAFSVLTVGWLLFSLLVFGVDETVDPRRFALLPVPARRLVPGLFVAGLLGVPGTATVLASLGLLATWARGPAMLVAAVVSVPLGIATAFLLSRAATAAFTQLLASRRFRDFAAVALALVGAAISIVANVVSQGTARDPAAARGMLATAAQTLGWTPFGWAWSVPAEVAAGRYAVAGVRLLLAVALVVGLWYAWGWFLSTALCSPLEIGGSSKPVQAHGLADRLYPATPTGAVAARSLRYWRRDPRYLSSLGGLCVAPIIIVVVTLIQPGDGAHPFVVYAPALLALLLGSVVAQDLSFDGSAVWAHLSTGVSGAADRAGRVLATSTVVGPVMLVMLVAVTVVTGRYGDLPRALALALGLTLIGVGVGSWVGSIWQMPAPPPGANPFAKNSGSGGGLKSMIVLGVTSGLTVLLGLPTIAAVIGSVWLPWLAWVSLLVAAVSGALVLRTGIRWGGARLDRRWPEVLQTVSTTD